MPCIPLIPPPVFDAGQSNFNQARNIIGLRSVKQLQPVSEGSIRIQDLVLDCPKMLGCDELIPDVPVIGDA